MPIIDICLALRDRFLRGIALSCLTCLTTILLLTCDCVRTYWIVFAKENARKEIVGGVEISICNVAVCQRMLKQVVY